MNYRCRLYGFATLLYGLTIKLPSCNNDIKFYFKKMCGFSYVPRKGLTIDTLLNHVNKTIVKNGALINSEMFDENLNNFLMAIPDIISS